MGDIKMRTYYKARERGTYVKFKTPKVEKKEWNVFSHHPVSNKDRSMPSVEEIYDINYLEDIKKNP